MSRDCKFCEKGSKEFLGKLSQDQLIEFTLGLIDYFLLPESMQRTVKSRYQFEWKYKGTQTEEEDMIEERATEKATALLLGQSEDEIKEKMVEFKRHVATYTMLMDMFASSIEHHPEDHESLPALKRTIAIARGEIERDSTPTSVDDFLRDMLRQLGL